MIEISRQGAQAAQEGANEAGASNKKQLESLPQTQRSQCSRDPQAALAPAQLKRGTSDLASPLPELCFLACEMRG